MEFDGRTPPRYVGNGMTSSHHLGTIERVTTSPDARKQESWDVVPAGSVEIRLARCASEVEAAQRLRYRVFYGEMGASASPETLASGLDRDRFDDIADHLLVIDRALGQGVESVVGTYRLIRRPAAKRLGGFYTADEYDISKLEAFNGEILELGRSCVDGRYRTRPTMQLLWRGIAAYVFHYDIRMMFGCASLPGIDVDALALPLSYLHHNHLAPEAVRTRALDRLYVDMDRLPSDRIDRRQALSALPPLIKGYLRLGGWVGDGAVVDTQFNTTDVCVLVGTRTISEKYLRHYEREARRGDETLPADTDGTS